MYIDSMEQFSAAQSIFASSADIISTNIIDLNPDLAANAANNGDPGPGEPFGIEVNISTGVTGGTSLAFILQTDTNTNFSTAMQEIPLTAALLPAALVAGTNFYFGIAPEQGLKRYIRLIYRNVGANTTGVATAAIVKDAQLNTSFVPAAFTVG
jgi:hypothetical protein